MVVASKAIDSLKTNKSGTALLRNVDIAYYSLFYLTGWAFFFTAYRISKYLHYKCKPHWFARLDQMTQKKWIAASISNLHAAIIVTTVCYIFTHSVCENSYAFIWFFDDTCFLTMDQRFVYCSLVSAAYLSHDLWHQKYVIGEKDKTANQTRAHHVVAIVAVFSAIMSGFSMPGIGCFILLVEISTVFLDLKLLLLKSEYDLCITKVIFISFLTSYFVFRIVLMPVALYLGVRMITLTFYQVGTLRKICMLFSFLQALLLTLLIYYWFGLILKIVLKLIGVIEEEETPLAKGDAKTATTETDNAINDAEVNEESV